MRDYRKLFSDGLKEDLNIPQSSGDSHVEWTNPYPWLYDEREHADGKCSICKINDIKDGFRYHCERCHSRAGVGMIYPETSINL